MDGQKCMAPRLPGSDYKYKAIFLAWVDAVNLDLEHTHCAGDKTKMQYTVDALVCLQEFDKGRIVQVPAFDIKFVDEWFSKED